MDYLSIQDVSNKWNISKRRVQILCHEGRINGAKMIGNMWVVPENAVRPADARKKNPIMEKKKSYSLVRTDLKKVLKCMYKKAEQYEFIESDKKIYVLSILSGVLCSTYIGTNESELEIINQIFFDISGKVNPYEIDKEILDMAVEFIKLYKNNKEVESVVSWAYQYSNRIIDNSDYSNTQFFTEKYMIDFIVHHIEELSLAKKILDPCLGGGNFLVECLEFLCAGCTEVDVENTVISQAKKLYGYDIDDIILSEYGTTVVGLEMMRSVNEENAEETRKVQIVKSAISTLSFSELEAIIHIFEELDGNEGILVASKIADRVGITRSVIVNALRKFESAGVIESRSSGMKGTYIKVLNDVVFDELKAIKASNSNLK